MSRQADLLFGLKDLISRFADVHGFLRGVDVQDRERCVDEAVRRVYVLLVESLQGVS